MSDYPVIQTSFNAGELSPEVLGRVDIEKYAAGCGLLRNFIPLIHGPITRRPGMEYIEDTDDSDKLSRLLEFEFSITQAYILELGDLLIRFFKDGGIILGGEMVVNGDMELDSNWTDVVGGTGTQSTEQRNDGDYSRKVVTLAIDDGVESDDFAMVSGITYTVSLYVYPPGVGINVLVLDGDGSELNGAGGVDHVVVAGQWNLITFEVTATATGALGNIAIRSSIGAETFYVDDVSIKKDGGAAGTGSVYELVSPYAHTELYDIDTAQSADTLYLVHGSHMPYILSRTDHDEWEITKMALVDGPWMDANLTSVTLRPSAATGDITIAASADLFRDDDVGRLVSIKHSTTTWGVAIITGVTDSQNVDATVTRDFSAATAQSDWKLGIWCDRFGYPQSITFSGDRLVFGGSPSFPQHQWLSKVGLYTDHGAAVNYAGVEATLADDDALAIPLGAKKVNSIRWLQGLRKLTVGTVGAEWWLASSTGEGAITATSKRAVLGSSHGSNDVKPIVVGHIVLFLQRYGKILHELKYSFEEDTYTGEELTRLVGHLTETYAITSLAYQNSPFRVVWAVRADGKLLSCTYSRSQNVIGWSVHETDGFVEDVAVIPGDTEDELWLIVKRGIGGSYVRYIERLHSAFVSDDLADAFFVDSGLSLDNRQTIGSITHASPGIINLTAHGYVDGDMVLFRTVDDDIVSQADYDSLHYEEYEVEKIDNDSFYLVDADSAYVDLSGYKEVFSATVGKMETSISGLGHLEGETLSVLVDGAHEEDKVVDSGAITLSGNGGSVVHAGLGYNSDLETLNPELSPSSELTFQSLTKRITAIAYRYYKSSGGKFGTDADNLKELMFVSDDVPMGRPANMMTGTTDFQSFEGAHTKDAVSYYRQDQPLPTTLLAVLTDIEPEED